LKDFEQPFRRLKPSKGEVNLRERVPFILIFGDVVRAAKGPVLGREFIDNTTHTPGIHAGGVGRVIVGDYFRRIIIRCATTKNCRQWSTSSLDRHAKVSNLPLIVGVRVKNYMRIYEWRRTVSRFQIPMNVSAPVDDDKASSNLFSDIENVVETPFRFPTIWYCLIVVHCVLSPLMNVLVHVESAELHVDEIMDALVELTPPKYMN
jgi:hypothetical protein